MTATTGSGTFRARRRAESRALVLTAVAGVALVALVAAAIGAMVLSFAGSFSTYSTLTATLPPGQPVSPGAEVTYRQVQIGTISGQGRSIGNGAVLVSMHLEPSKLAAIPANVTISVAPSSVFGVQAVVLTPPTRPAGHLHAGQTLAPAPTGSASLQTGLADINRVLTGLHPAQIETTLSALSTAMAGQGPGLGTAVDQLTSYLDGLIPQLPTLNGDITALTPVLSGLSTSVPDLLATAANSSTVARTITGSAANLLSLLRTGQVVTSQATTLLNEIDGTLHAFLTNFLPVLIDVQANPNVIPRTLTNLDTLARAFFPAFEQGRYVHVTANFYVSDPEDALFAASFLLPPALEHSEAHAAFKSLTDVPAYTAADCPRYGAEVGPNCAGTPSSRPAAVPQAAASPVAGLPAGGELAPSAALAPAAQTRAAASLLAQRSGTPVASVQSAVASLLGSLLGSLVP